MKKSALVITIAALTAISAGCGKKVSSSEKTRQPKPTVTTEAPTESPTTATSTEPATEPTTAFIEGYLVKEEGGVQFGKPIAEQDEDLLIAAAEDLFNSACETEWKFTVGSPYELDRTKSVQNSLGWDFFLITDKNINSLADIRADYHKVFSEQYKDAIEETFMESGGHAYCFDGSRGSNIFYTETVITGIKSKSETEMVFTIDNCFTSDGYGGGEYVSSEEFAITLDPDGIWRVLKFRLPY